jgi:octaprenyl-diphosphate synthase
MAQENSFDIVSKVDIQEVRNAIDQALKEIRQRFDLKDSHSDVTLEGSEAIQLASAGEYKLEAVKEILGQKLVKRGVSLKNLTYEKLEQGSGQSVRQKIKLQQGIPVEKAKEIVRLVKDSKKKAQASIQGDTVRPRRAAGDYRVAARQRSGRGVAVYQLPYELITGIEKREKRRTLSTLAIATAREVFDLLRDDLMAIEQELGRDAASGVSTITEIAEYLRAGGGKRIRPSLLLLSAHMLGFSGQGAIRLGAVVEMVHTATLVHDDIIDGADTRRGRPSANTTWGNEKCVLAGDWLYMQAFRVALEEKNLRVLDLLIGLTQQMVEGELLQIQKLGKAVCEAEYYDLIFRKTACLFSVSMRLGAVLAGASEAVEASLSAYGRAVGLAFQIVDDVLDLTATEEVLGKPVASDLREGKATLSVIHSFDHGIARDRQTIQRVLDDRSFENVSRQQIQEILERNGSVEYAMAIADRYAEQSREALSSMAESEFKRALLWVPDFVVSRVN